MGLRLILAPMNSSSAQLSRGHGLQKQVSVLDAPAKTWAATEMALQDLVGSPELAIPMLQTSRGHASFSPRAGRQRDPVGTA